MSDAEEVDPRRGRYPCPRCQRVLRVASSGEIFRPLLYPSTIAGAFRGYSCDHCGPIPFKELPGDAKVIRALMLLAAVCVLFFVGVLVFALATKP